MSEFVVLFVNLLASALWMALIARVIVSWINIDRSSPLYPVAAIIHQITEPILAPIRSVLPSFGMLDLSPMVAIILIIVVQRVIVAAAS